jgi:hypothetical protein
MGTVLNVIAVYLGLLCLFLLISLIVGLGFNVATMVISPAVVASIFLVTGLSEPEARG